MKSKEQIDKGFIEAFGEERFKIQEAINKLEKTSKLLSDYLEVPELPIVCEPIKEDSRIYFKEEFIILRKDIALNYLEGLKAITHEYRHFYQYRCIVEKRYEEELLDFYVEDFTKLTQKTNPLEGTDDYYSSVIELDAFAFTKYFLQNVLDIETHYPRLYFYFQKKCRK